MKKSLINFWKERMLPLINKKIFAVGFLAETATVVACDIDKGNVKKITSFAQNEFEKNCFENGKITDVPCVGKTLRKTLDEVKPDKLKTNFCVAVIPDNQVFFRAFFMDRPKDPKADLAKLIEKEVQELLPLPTTEYKYVYKLEYFTDKLIVGIAAIDRETLAAYYEAMKFKAGMEPKGIFAYSTALLIGFPKLIFGDEITIYLYGCCGGFHWRLYYKGVIFDSNDVLVDEQGLWQQLVVDDINSAVYLLKEKLRGVKVRLVGQKESADYVNSMMLLLKDKLDLDKVVVWGPDVKLESLDKCNSQADVLLGLLRKSENLLKTDNLLNLQL